jgi:hypothetical protein
MRRSAQFLFIAVFLLFMLGCGSQSQVTTTPVINPANPATVPVSLTVTDTPPAGVTVLFFQLSITGATLSPGNVSLLPGSNPIPVNVSQLQTNSAFLGSQDVAAGTYTGLTLTFANPELTIFNGSGATIGSGSTACANNTVCQLTPTATSMNVSLTSAPFPITVTATSPPAFQLDINLNTVIQSDLSVNLGVTNGVTIAQLPPPPTGTNVMPIGNLTGAIQSVNSTTSPDSFVLQTGDGRTFTIDVGSSTTYSGFPSSACSSETFACLAAQQIVNLQMNLQTAGTLLASQVTYVQPGGQMMVQGNIIRLSTSGGNTMMDLILQQGPPPPPGANAIPFGQRATVTVPGTGVNYAVDAGSYTIPSGLTFTGASSLAVGQQVSVAVAAGSVTAPSSPPSSTAILAPAPNTFTATGITLEPSQITGTVTAINASALSFTLSTMQNFFLPPAPNATAPPTPTSTSITVQTTAGTTFTGFTTESIAGLATTDVVSVGGWVFSTPTGTTTITQAAQAVLDRPAPTPGVTPLF